MKQQPTSQELLEGAEIFDVIDLNNNVIGQATRDQVHSEGLCHRVVAVLLKNERGEYFCPKPAEYKVDSGLYHSAGGHVSAGESCRQAVVRETEEELGITLQEENLILLGSFWINVDHPTRIEREWVEIFEASYSDSMGPIHLNREYESGSDQWFTRDELQKIYRENPDQLTTPLRTTCEKFFGFN